MTRSIEEAARRVSPDGLRDLLAVVNSSRGVDEILAYLVAKTGEVLEADGAAVYLIDPLDPRLLRIQAREGIPGRLLADTNPVGSPITGLAVSRGQAVVVSDLAETLTRPAAATTDEQLVDHGSYVEIFRPGPVTRADKAQRLRNDEIASTYRTLLAVPLAAHEEIYGALQLFYTQRRQVGPAELDLCLAFAQQAALALENARLRSEAEHRLDEIARRQRVAEALRDLLAVINSSPHLEDILDEALKQSSRLLGNNAGVVYLRQHETDDTLHVRASIGLSAEQLASEVRVGSPTTGLAVQKSRTLVCWDLTEALGHPSLRAADTVLEDFGTYERVVRLGPRTDPDLEPDSPIPRVQRLAVQFRALIATPLVARGRTLGAITLFHAEPHRFSAEEVDLVNAFAQQLSLAIENARLHAEAEQRTLENERRRRVAEAMRDMVAIVNSTRSLDEILDQVLEQASDLLGSDAGSVLLLDPEPDRPDMLTVRASRALAPDIVPMRLPVGSAITGVAVQRGRPMVVSDLEMAQPIPGQFSPDFNDRGDFVELLRVADPGQEIFESSNFPRARVVARHYRAVLAVPLAIRGDLLGAITMYYKSPREFSRDEVALAQSFADQTALAIENARLHAQTLRRSRDLEALYRADEVLYRSLRLDQVLQALVDVASDVLQADMTSVLVWDERHERLIPGATRGFAPESLAGMSHALGEGITGLVALTGQPVTVEDARNDPRVVHRITDPEGISSLLHVPIKVNDEVFGVFGVNFRNKRSFSGEEERTLLALAHRATVAIENAQLYTESEQQREELEALYRADETLHRSLRLDDVLKALVEVATGVLRADKTSVHLWDADHGKLLTAASHGYAAETIVETLAPDQDTFLLGAMQEGGMLVMEDPAEDPRLSERLRALVKREGIRSGIAVPITVAGQIFGLFGIAFSRRRAPTRQDKRIVQAIAQRAGLAIQNARLFEQAQQAATTEERERLARELHDAVTQTLFSASLIAEVVPRLWDRDPAEGHRRVEELRRLTRGALSEMRTLLLELRPAALIETPFNQLMTQLAETTVSRSNVEVAVHVDGEASSLPAEVHIALYRIVQESLNNVGKHASADHVEIHVRWHPSGVDLRVKDDGCGFVLGAGPQGRLGLGIMRERARSIGAQLRLHSAPERGTAVNLHWRSAQ